MKEKLSAALNDIECSYQELIEWANDIILPITSPVDEIINEISSNSKNLTIDAIRDYIVQLQLKAYELSDIREKSTFKATLATNKQKQEFAATFNSLSGAAAVREKLAMAENSENVVGEAFYSLMAALLKSKQDAIHRMVDSLKSVLMSRMQETKFMQLGSTNEINPTKYFNDTIK